MNPLEQKFHDLIARVEDASRRAGEDKLINFEMLSQEITLACSEAQAAAPNVAKVVKPLMGELVGKLDHLAVSITDYQQRLQDKKSGKVT